MPRIGISGDQKRSRWVRLRERVHDAAKSLGLGRGALPDRDED